MPTDPAKSEFRKNIARLLLLLWAILIFFLSSQPGKESGESGKWLIEFIASFGIDLKAIFGEWTSYVIRKTAHFTEFFIFTLLAYNVAKRETVVTRPLLLSFLLAVSYATTDEIHQYFVPDRVATPVDVMIDAAGAGLATALIAWRQSRKRPHSPA